MKTSVMKKMIDELQEKNKKLAEERDANVICIKALMNECSKEEQETEYEN